ncbi:MAG: GNAT family N-acetyltransferase [Rhizobiales bacterium]|nr:GNAT family N-acetyltransferase [Hyphomicrobiales bacterium]
MRNIEPADHDALAALWIRAWMLTLPQIRFDERELFIRERFHDYAQPPRHARVACNEAGQPLGFCLIDTNLNELEQIVVAPEFWGKGTAEAMLDDARCLSPDRLILTVNRDNPRAIAFYRRQGFVETGESVSPRSGLPLLHMEWRAALTP